MKALVRILGRFNHIIDIRVLELHCSPFGGLVLPYDGLEPGNRLRRLGLWGTIYAGPFPLGLILVLMGDLLKYIHTSLTHLHLNISISGV